MVDVMTPGGFDTPPAAATQPPGIADQARPRPDRRARWLRRCALVGQGCAGVRFDSLRSLSDRGG